MTVADTKQGHPHAESIIQYGEDLREDAKAYLNWEYRFRGGTHWYACNAVPQWSYGTEYRRKPKRLQYTVDIPAPIPPHEVIPEGTRVYCPLLLANPDKNWSIDIVSSYPYSKSETATAHRQKRGMLFRTYEDAVEAWKALAPFGSTK